MRYCYRDKKIRYNGIDLEKLIYNNVVVFTSKPSSVNLFQCILDKTVTYKLNSSYWGDDEDDAYCGFFPVSATLSNNLYCSCEGGEMDCTLKLTIPNSIKEGYEYISCVIETYHYDCLSSSGYGYFNILGSNYTINDTKYHPEIRNRTFTRSLSNYSGDTIDLIKYDIHDYSGYNMLDINILELYLH